jgi:hypothetical protein
MYLTKQKIKSKGNRQTERPQLDGLATYLNTSGYESRGGKIRMGAQNKLATSRPSTRAKRQRRSKWRMKQLKKQSALEATV